MRARIVAEVFWQPNIRNDRFRAGHNTDIVSISRFDFPRML